MDGGGIKGLFPATVLAELERRYLGGRSIASYFDLVAGTSTGGILALGLGAGLTATALADLYADAARRFSRPHRIAVGPHAARGGGQSGIISLPLQREALEELLTDTLGEKLFGRFDRRLCIPAFEGKHSEVFVFKTPHHADYKFDRLEPMVNVGARDVGGADLLPARSNTTVIRSSMAASGRTIPSCWR